MNEFEQCYEIYCEAFGEDEFAKKLFDTYFSECRFIKSEARVVAMLFLLPCQIDINGAVYPSQYLFAAATLAQYRGNGYMSKLISELNEDTGKIIFLKPADDTLINFYKKLDFTPFKAIRSISGQKSVIVDDRFKALSGIPLCNGESYTAMYCYKEPLQLDNLAFAYTME